MFVFKPVLVRLFSYQSCYLKDSPTHSTVFMVDVEGLFGGRAVAMLGVRT